MNELVADFKKESQELVGKMLVILETIEGDSSRFAQLEQYGQIVDRIMGAAKSLALMEPDLKEVMQSIGEYSELCKEVAYKGSQVPNNEALFSAVVGLLFDGAESIDRMLSNIENQKFIDFKGALNKTFLDRLLWISKQFGANLRGTLDTTQNNSASEIEIILKKFGL